MGKNIFTFLPRLCPLSLSLSFSPSLQLLPERYETALGTTFLGLGRKREKEADQVLFFGLLGPPCEKREGENGVATNIDKSI